MPRRRLPTSPTPVQKAHPQFPTQCGAGGRQGRTRAAHRLRDQGPRPLPAPSAARREPMNRVGAGLGRTSRLQGKAGVCKARHRIRGGRENPWGLSTSRLSQVRSPVSSPQVPTFLPLKFGPRGLLSLAAAAWPGESGCTCFRRIMVALEVGLPSLHRSLAPSSPALRALPPSPSTPRPPPPPAPPARRPLAATRSPGSVAAPRSPEPAAPADRTARPAAGTEPPAREEGAAQAAAARRGGARAGTRAGPGAGTPGSRSPGAGASEQASREDREGGAPPERAELPTKCDAPAGLGRAAAGAARRGGRTPGSCAAPGGAEGQPQRAAAGRGCDPSEPHAPRGLTGRSPHGAAGPDR